VWIVGLILAMHDTPLHRLFYLIPEFERIHQHSPQRLLWVITLAPAMLVGATVQTLLTHPPQRYTRLLVLPPLIAIFAVGISLAATDAKVGWLPFASATIAAVLVLIATHPWSASSSREHAMTMGRYAMVGIIALVFLFPAGSDVVAGVFGIQSLRPLLVTDAETTQIIDTYFSRTDPGGAGEFLQKEQQQGEIFRFVSYAGRDPATNQPSYSTLRLEPSVIAVLVNGRAARLGLESIQGYNPSHLLAYDQYVAAMNGGYQNYHWSDPFRDALGPNPLMDMLNVRYILVDAKIPEDSPEIAWIASGRKVVFSNANVVIYENPDVYARAWIVHDVRPETPESLDELKTGQVDGRQVAFVDGPVPALSQPSSGEDSVQITGRSGDQLTAKATTSASGLVVFSEIYAKGWNAYVDGKQVDVVQTNHALRGVPVDAGTHKVELRFKPRSLQIGLWITVITSIGILVVSALAIGTWLRPRLKSPTPLE
ncbi:MAG: YfhO family protein, partial [Thermomicrobiales bacterium]